MPNTEVGPVNEDIEEATCIATKAYDEVIRIGNVGTENGGNGTTEIDLDSGSGGIDIKSFLGGDINLYATTTGKDATAGGGTSNINISSNNLIQIGESFNDNGSISNIVGNTVTVSSTSNHPNTGNNANLHPMTGDLILIASNPTSNDSRNYRFYYKHTGTTTFDLFENIACTTAASIEGTWNSDSKWFLDIRTDITGLDFDGAKCGEIDNTKIFSFSTQLNPQIVLKTSKNMIDAIKLHADAGGTQTITIVNDAGTSESAIALTSTLGGVDIDAGVTKDVNISGGQVALVSKDDVASAISLTANIGSSETIVVTNTKGTSESAIALISTLGGIDMDCLGASGVLSLDTAGGDIEVGVNANAGDINIGTNTTERTITLGNATGASSLVLECGTGALNIGTNTIARTITMGNATGASKLDFDAGTGGIDMDCLGASGVLSLDTAGGDIEVGVNANAGDINIGTNTTARTITIGDVDGGLAGDNHVFIHGSVHIDAHTSYGSYVSLNGEGTPFTSAVNTFYNSIDWYDGADTKVFQLPDTRGITGKATVVYYQSIWPAAGTDTLTFQCDSATKLRHIVFPKKNSGISGAVEFAKEAIGRKEFIYTSEFTSTQNGLLKRGQSIIFAYMGTQARGWAVKFNPEISLYHHSNDVEGVWSFGDNGY